MSNWYISEKTLDEKLQNTAGVKARDDAEQIFEEMGFTPIFLSSADRTNQSKLKKLTFHAKLVSIWKKNLKDLKAGDSLFVQFPFVDHSVFLAPFFKKLKKRGVKVNVLIHDLDSFRFFLRTDVKKVERMRVKLEEDVLKYVNRIIVHNSRMKEVMVRRGYEAERLVPLGIFDYLIPDADEERFAERKNEKDMPVIIAGTLRPHKAAYAYNLPKTGSYIMYGVGYEGETNERIAYMGAFPPDDLPYEMEGSFGLVWDGGTADTCDGVFGQYLKINNPHKTSLYLASGIPVIIWDEAALAGFIEKNHCGLSVASLSDIPEKIAALTEEDYAAMKENARKTGLRLREGAYLKRAIKASLE